MASEERKPQRLYRNLTSLVGATIVVASITSILLLFLIELIGTRHKPYLGIFTYIIFPAVMLMGLAIVVFGVLLERRRRHKADSSDPPFYGVRCCL